MGLPKLKFPHISRLFTAILLWCGLVAVFYVNVFVQIHNNQSFPSYFFQTLTHPFNPQPHVDSALTLRNQGFNQSAKRELTIAEDLYKAGNGSVLGATTDPSVILNDWKAEPQILKDKYNYWKKIIVQKPDYRDGYIISGILAYELGKVQEAKSLFTKARELDPNYKLPDDLLKKISE